MKRFLPLFMFAIFLFLPLETNASQKVLGFGTLFFGTEEKIAKIQDLPETEYKLCHKYTYYSYLAGIYLTDDGYVLQEKENNSRYIPLDKSRIAELQESGLLPNPLPNYSIPISAYIFGYSLWWSILIVLALFFFSYRSSQRKNQN